VKRFVRRREVLHRYACGNTKLYADIAAGLFPRPIHLGAKSSVWLESELEALIAARARSATDSDVRHLVCALETARQEAA
jgi:prophage regulatory protein